VPTLLADPPAGPGARQAPPPAPDSPQDGQPAPEAQRQCAKCGAPLAAGQDWCTNCGAGAPGSLGALSPGWRSAAAVLTALAVLIAGAATAGYAALHKSKGTSSSTRPAGALAAVPGAPAAPVQPATPVPPAATAKPPPIGAPTTIKPVIPLKTPKLPLGGVTPKLPKTPAVSAPPPAVKVGGNTTPSTTTKKSHAKAAPVPVSVSEPASAILLDTDAASTYNPYGHPVGNYGDPRLAIDGDTSTGWTARVEPAGAPNMAEGLLIDLNSPQRVSAVALVTSTPGMTIQIYGANGTSAPASITDPAWSRLSGSMIDRKKRLRISLTSATRAHRFVLLWISRAPSASSARVTVNELELFPPK